jgi:7-cyano-7-deazaguanine reductase
MPTQPSKTLETFPNPHPGRDYIIEIEAPEFTCLCPKTGQPDFATLHLEYVPDRLCVELKSLKLYIWSYRNEGHFHEDVTNRILDDLVAATNPRYLRLVAKFYVRGGIYTTVTVEHRASGWRTPAPPPDDLPREKQVEQNDPVAAEPVPAPPAAVEPTVAPVATDTSVAAEPPATPAPAARPRTARAPSEPASGGRFRMLRRSRRAPAEDVVETPPAAAEPPPAPTPAPPPKPSRPAPVYLGIDLGSTGCRMVAVDGEGKPLAHTEASFPAATRREGQITQDPTRWWKAVTDSLQHLLTQVDPAAVRAIAVDGTSSTVLLADAQGNPLTPAILYNDQRAQEEAERIAQHAERHSGAQGATSSLAKLLWLQGKELTERAAHLLHQADWISGRLTGVFGHSDYNNCLKLGYDALKGEWPAWLDALRIDRNLLPQVHAPGEALAAVSGEIAKAFGFHPDTQIIAGTTDGVASFIAAGGSEPGHGVTSLGTTLVIKLLCDQPVFSAEHGVYSHRLGDYWLAGGASNSGGAVLLQYFKTEQMREMTPLLDPDNPTDLNYYPLPDVGERFPVNDPQMMPRLEPLPGDSVTFFQGLLEGIARIEAMSYELLASLGAPKVTLVRTTGGGAVNTAWERIRARTLGVKMETARSNLAAYGTALLAAGLAVKSTAKESAAARARG